jgi:hypothetical protein
MNRQSWNFRRPRSLTFSRLTELAAIAFAAVLAQAFAQQPAPAQPPSFLAEQVAEATATVTALDPANRLISLKTDDGRELTVEAGEEVRNFSQIEVGDEVTVQYYQALAAEVTKAEASDDDRAEVLLGARAPEGDKPAGAIGTVHTAIVTIDSVDTGANTVSFTDPDGKKRETKVQRDQGREFISQLKPGDRVQLTYGESLAIAVAPADEERALR